jgi:uncharacterized protein (DUF3084 family)
MSDSNSADALAQRDAALAQRDAALAQRDAVLAQRDAALAQAEVVEKRADFLSVTLAQALHNNEKLQNALEQVRGTAF